MEEDDILAWKTEQGLTYLFAQTLRHRENCLRRGDLEEEKAPRSMSNFFVKNTQPPNNDKRMQTLGNSELKGGRREQ